MNTETSKQAGLGACVRRLRERDGIGMNELARKLGWAPALLSKRERGLLRIKPEHRAQIAKALGMTLAELDRAWKQGALPAGEASAGSPDHWAGFDDGGVGVAEPGSNLATIRVRGDSMEPTLLDGDVCLVRMIEQTERVADGSVVCAWLGNDAATPGGMFARWFGVGATVVELAKDNRAFRNLTVSRVAVVRLGVVVERRTRSL